MQTTLGVPRRLEFEYDHRGRRIEKKIYDAATGGTLIRHIRNAYDGWNVIAEFATSGSLLCRHLWGLDLSGNSQGAGGVGGLVAILGNTVGAGTALYEYGRFGEPIRATGDSIIFANPLRFSTKYMDGESGFLNNGRRVYNPTTGRVG